MWNPLPTTVATPQGRFLRRLGCQSGRQAEPAGAVPRAKRRGRSRQHRGGGRRSRWSWSPSYSAPTAGRLPGHWVSPLGWDVPICPSTAPCSHHVGWEDEEEDHRTPAQGQQASPGPCARTPALPTPWTYINDHCGQATLSQWAQRGSLCPLLSGRVPAARGCPSLHTSPSTAWPGTHWGLRPTPAPVHT